MLRNIRKVRRFNQGCWIALCSLALLFAGCTTREQGCLDIYAANFDLTAEKPCDGCCLYPALNVSLSQRWHDRNFNNTDTLFDINGLPYQITDIKYFLSDWVIDGSDGASYRVDSTILGCVPPVLAGLDILLVDSRQFTYEVGIIRTAPNMDSLCLTLGLETIYPCIENDTTDKYVNLSNKSPLWNPTTDALSAIRLVVKGDLQSELLDTLYIDFTARDTIAYPFAFVIGSHTTLKLSVNYGQWFATVNREIPASFGNSVAAGFDGSIYVTPE